jgi:hypothetical protein
MKARRKAGFFIGRGIADEADFLIAISRPESGSLAATLPNQAPQKQETRLLGGFPVDHLIFASL